MHILIIPSWYSTPENPVSGIFFREQAEALHKAGHQVGILTFAYDSITKVPKKGLLPYVAIEDNRGIPVYRLHLLKIFQNYAPVHLAMLRSFGLIVYRQYKRHQGRPDVIHAHSILYGGYVAVHIRGERAIPVVLTEHSSAFLRGMVNGIKAEAVRYTLKHANRNFAVSQALAEELNRFIPECRVEVIGNMVDGDFFTLPTSPQSTDQAFTFALTANLIKLKGVDLLLKAFAQVFKGKKVRLRLAGSGEELQNLRDLAVQLQIEGQIEFLGRLNRNQVRDLLQSSQVLVSSSYVETFGVTLIEALACGKPVVATRSGGPENIVNEVNGLLLPPGDVNALSNALLQMMNTYSSYDPVKIRADCLERFGQNAFVARQERIYRELTGEK